MKTNISPKIYLSLVLAVVIMFFCSSIVFANDTSNDDNIVSENNEENIISENEEEMPEEIVYDNTPKDTAATLIVNNKDIIVEQFDGKIVNWTVPRRSSRSLRIRVPSGRHKLIIVDNHEKVELSLHFIYGEDYEVISEIGGKPSIKGKTLSTPEPAGTSSSGSVYVRGYYRKNGTYVRGHYRSRPRR
jgi:hypothetical protein